MVWRPEKATKMDLLCHNDWTALGEFIHSSKGSLCMETKTHPKLCTPSYEDTAVSYQVTCHEIFKRRVHTKARKFLTSVSRNRFCDGLIKFRSLPKQKLLQRFGFRWSLVPAFVSTMVVVTSGGEKFPACFQRCFSIKAENRAKNCRCKRSIAGHSRNCWSQV